MSDWRPYAVRLADQLHARGDLRTPAWHAAIAETPRHVLVPIVYEPQQQFRGSRTDVRLSAADHLELVYSTTTLVTAVVPNQYGSLMSVSSSTKPDLMVRMLEALDVREGQRILEIGTGTGYNAALLAHRLGDDNVFSVDVDPELVNTAQQRLAHIGRHPHLAVQNGAEGWRQHAPYSRIICTCAVRRIPWAWYEQLTPGGQLLVDFKPQGGNLVLLEKKSRPARRPIHRMVWRIYGHAPARPPRRQAKPAVAARTALGPTTLNHNARRTVRRRAVPQIGNVDDPATARVHLRRADPTTHRG